MHKDVSEEGVSKRRSEQGRLAESVQVKTIPGTNPEAEGNKDKDKVSATDSQGRKIPAINRSFILDYKEKSQYLQQNADIIFIGVSIYSSNSEF